MKKSCRLCEATISSLLKISTSPSNDSNDLDGDTGEVKFYVNIFKLSKHFWGISLWTQVVLRLDTSQKRFHSLQKRKLEVRHCFYWPWTQEHWYVDQKLKSLRGMKLFLISVGMIWTAQKSLVFVWRKTNKITFVSLSNYATHKEWQN